MKTLWKLILAGSACLLVVGCNPPTQSQRDADLTQSEPEGGKFEDEEPVAEQVASKQNDTPEYVQSLWDRSVAIAKPCENSAAVLADRIAFTSPQNALPDAKKGLETCEVAIKKQKVIWL